MNYTNADCKQFLQVNTTLFCPFLENFIAPTILMLLLRVNTYSTSNICMLCWECIGASIYGLGAGRFLPNLYQAHKLRSCYLSHLPSNTESEHSTAPGSADRPGGNGVHLHTTVGHRHPAFFAKVTRSICTRTNIRSKVTFFSTTPNTYSE